MKQKIRQKYASLFIIITLFFGAPSFVRAVSFGDLNTQIAELLAQVFTLKAQLKTITNLDVTATELPKGETYEGQVPYDMSCLILKNNMSLGSRGKDITRLQLYLARQSYIYPEAIISGYFGTMTKRAVERWQIINGITSPYSSGYGVVGPQTRKSFRGGCPPEKEEKKDDTKKPIYDVLIKGVDTNKAIGSKPFKVISTFTLVDKCTSFVLDWGDQTAPYKYDARGKRCDGSQNKMAINHVYPRNGVYLMVLRAGRDETPGALKLVLPVVFNKAVVVGGNLVPFTLTPLRGTAPFSATAKFSITHPSCTSYAIAWGDGTQNTQFDASEFTCARNPQTRVLTHVYDEPGIYTVLFKKGRAPVDNLPVSEQWEIAVDELQAGKTIVQVSKSTGRAPLTVQVKLSGADGVCSSYSVNWGDGTPTPRSEWLPPKKETQFGGTDQNQQVDDGDFVSASDGDFVEEDVYNVEEDCTGSYDRALTHTYISYGSYPLQIKFGKGALKDIQNTQHWVSVLR